MKTSPQPQVTEVWRTDWGGGGGPYLLLKPVVKVADIGQIQVETGSQTLCFYMAGETSLLDLPHENLCNIRVIDGLAQACGQVGH